MDILSVEVSTADDYPFASVASRRAHALMAHRNPGNFKNRKLIADFALRSGLPSPTRRGSSSRPAVSCPTHPVS
jgi:hypothetical protein